MGRIVWDRRARRRLLRLGTGAVCWALVAGGVPSRYINESRLSAGEATANRAPVLTNPGPRTNDDRQVSYPEIVLSDGPVAYWRLGDSSVSAVTDAAGTTAPARVGGVAAGQPG